MRLQDNDPKEPVVEPDVPIEKEDDTDYEEDEKEDEEEKEDKDEPVFDEETGETLN
jgi:hypothetical protein